MTLHVYRPPSFRWRLIRRCGRCRRRTRHIAESYVWFATSLRCCACGARAGNGMPMKPKRNYEAREAVVLRREWPTLPNRDAMRRWLSDWLDANLE